MIQKVIWIFSPIAQQRKEIGQYFLNLDLRFCASKRVEGLKHTFAKKTKTSAMRSETFSSDIIRLKFPSFDFHSKDVLFHG
jgi:hypothetical protein